MSALVADIRIDGATVSPADGEAVDFPGRPGGHTRQAKAN